jgi:co-chaperonin GroES (HSP10)
MAVNEPTRILEYSEGDDPRKIVFDAIGDGLDNFPTLYRNEVLVVTAPTMTKSRGGIIFADKTKGEERFQGKIGLVIKLGEIAFNDPDLWPDEHTRPDVGDWVLYRNADTTECAINGVSCRFISDGYVKGRVLTPNAVR